MPKTVQETLPAVRRQSITELINTRGNTTVIELCRYLKVSPATVRNDLTALENAGMIKRVHGGAISINSAGYEPNTTQKEIIHVAEKQAIAQKAVRLINDGDAIALDTGTTTYELAKLLAGIEKLTVVTNDLRISAWLEANTKVQIILAGGQVRRGFNCTTGQTVLDMISKLHVDKLFLAANGISARNGLSTPNMETATIKRQFLQSAEQVFLLADSSKANKNAFAGFAALNEVDVWITDGKLPKALRQEAVEAGVDLVIT